MELTYSKEESLKLLNYAKCDKYDYLVSAGIGAISGIIDVFLVGAPDKSILNPWTDKQVDQFVMKSAKLLGWKPREGNERNVASAIGFFERSSRVNYDQKNTSDVGGLFNMAAKNHHMKSLGHSPDIIGLLFSIVNQFTSTSSFISNGELITIQTETFELQGHDFYSRLFCGFTNWIGHIMSDIAGSSGNRGGKGRGSGVVMPLYELLGLCNFGKFRIGDDLQSLAILATRAFQEGYDLRFAITMSIPVIFCNLAIKLFWAIKKHFYYKRPLKECFPLSVYENLRVMLLIGNGTLCVIDGVGALIESGGNALNFFLHFNLIAWYKFITLVINEILLRLGIEIGIQKELAAYKRMYVALSEYFSELQKIDAAKFEEEYQRFNAFCNKLSDIQSEKELSDLLYHGCDCLGVEISWSQHKSFDDFMQDKQSILVIK